MIISKDHMDGLCHTNLHLRIEDELILACASTSVEGGQRKAIRQIAGQCKDWDYLLHTARGHGVTPLVSTNLDRAAGDIVPRESLELLRRRFRLNAVRNLFLTQELVSLIREFGADGIDVIPLKGPLLAMTAYGDVALREFLDLDILVPKQHLDRAGQLLIRCGYRRPLGQAGESRSIHVEAQLGCDFFREDGRVSIELHWSFLQKWLGFGVDLDALWQEPKRVALGGANVIELPKEIALLYLCAHGTKHYWTRLSWVVDVAEFIRARPSVDWDLLLETAKRMGSRRTLFMGLHMAHTLLGLELPEKVWTQMKNDDCAESLAQELCGRLFSTGAQAAINHGGWANDWFHLRTKERWQDRLRYLRYLAGWVILPSKKDKQWMHLPAGLGWLYIFLRPIRAAWQVVHPSSRNGAAPPRP